MPVVSLTVISRPHTANVNLTEPLLNTEYNTLLAVSRHVLVCRRAPCTADRKTHTLTIRQSTINNARTTRHAIHVYNAIKTYGTTNP